MPQRLYEKPKVTWSVELPSDGLGGIAANQQYVVLGMRDVLDKKDVFRCYSTADGKLLWQYDYAAEGRLDYGNSPRATPLLKDGMVYLQGAFGHLSCLDLETGVEFWKVNLLKKFDAEVQTWGNCWSPVFADGKLIVQPGGKLASLAALDPLSGETIWKTPGLPPAYCSPIVARFGGVQQVIGYDKTTLGGWDVKTGKRLWTLTPEAKNDFNVPTPIRIGEQLFLATENNGARLYGFDDQGKIKSEPVARFEDLAPDTHTPVVTQGRIYGICAGLFCLSATDLKQIWLEESEEYEQYASIVASAERALVTTLDGQLILLDLKGDDYQLINKVRLVEGEIEIHSHPAFVGRAAYFRAGKQLLKLQLGSEKP